MSEVLIPNILYLSCIFLAGVCVGTLLGLSVVIEEAEEK